MSAIEQYLDLYRNHRDVIDANGAAPQNALRSRAADVLGRIPLPRKGDENFENIDIESLLAPDYGINLQKVDIDVNPQVTFRCDVPVATPGRVFMNLNDTFVAPAKGENEYPEGVEVCSLRQKALENPGFVEKYYGKLADIDNPLVALDTLFAQDGLFVHIPANIQVDRPIQLVNILASTFPLMAARRALIIIDDYSSAKLLVCDHSQNDTISSLALGTVEIFVGHGASFAYYDLEESTRVTTHLSTLYLQQEADSKVTVDGLTLFNGTTRNEYYCNFKGENASLRLYGMGIEDRDRALSTYSHISHSVPRCHSDELFKFSADDKSTASFTGRIYVAEGAIGTEAYQSNRNLCGNGGAKIYSKPQLEIYNDDVKCSHGCAIGQLDPLQVFYMRTRGIPLDTARLLLRQAFMSDVIDAIEVPSLRDRLHILVERRFAGLESACGSCGGCSQDNQ